MSRSENRSRDEGKMSSADITPVLKGWDYEPGTINVRKISGNDGQPKLQMRVDLGVLQMEMTGRPDGAKPHGCESLLEFHERELNEYRLRHGSEMGFQIDRNDCQALRDEAVMYYQRYLGLFVLEDFVAVMRDTARNLRVLDLCFKFASDEHDRIILEQYRPYIIMMNSRAEASIHFNNKEYKPALVVVERGLENIRTFFTKFEQDDAFAKSNEVRILKKFAHEIRRKIPLDPMEKLQQQLDKAVKTERYEEAAKLRDQIRRLQASA